MSASPRVSPPTLLVTDLPPDCDRQLVINTLRAAAMEGIKYIDFNDKAHSACFGTNTMDGVGRLVATTLVIGGNRIHVQLYYPESPNPDIQDVVEVTGITKEMKKELLLLYFENTRRSGGGEVLDMNVDYNSNTAQIRFKDKQAACGMAFRYRHIVEGVEIRVNYPEHPGKLTPGKMVTSVDKKEKISIRESGDTKDCRAYGVCSLPDGGWLVTDIGNQVLKRLDVNGNVVDRCPVSGMLNDVCFIEVYKLAAVTTGGERTIELISLDGDSMTWVRTIKMIPLAHYCYGVTYAHNKLYISAKNAEIYERDFNDGKLLRRISPRDMKRKNIFHKTCSVTSSEDGSRLFMTDSNNTVFIIDTTTADVIQRIGEITGIVCLGEDDGLFVATGRDGIVHLNRNGTKLGTVVTKEMIDGLYPCDISYDKRTARLAVTVGGRLCDYVFVFHMK